MIRYESQCVSCGFPCRYEACRYYKVRVLECDTAVMKLTSCIGLMEMNFARAACWRDWRLWNERIS